MLNVNMKETGVFISPDELRQVKVEDVCSKIVCNSETKETVGDTKRLVLKLILKYDMELNCALDISTGQFIEPIFISASTGGSNA